MKKETRIAKARAKHIRELYEIEPVNSVVQMERISGINRNIISNALQKHDPELYIRLNGHLNDYLMLDIKTNLLKQLDVSKDSLKFQRFIAFLVNGIRDKQELAIKCNVSLRQVYRFINKLRDKIDVIRED